MTRPWNRNELEAIGAAAELSVAPRRPDGTLRPFTTIWVVRISDDVYVQSYRGPSGRVSGCGSRRLWAYQSRRGPARRELRANSGR